MEISIKKTREIPLESIIALYQANNWSSANKPNQLYHALMNSDTLVSAWHSKVLVGIASAISDGHLVVYYPHLLVLPTYQRQGIGKKLIDVMLNTYTDFHQQLITADSQATAFYVWIYGGSEH